MKKIILLKKSFTIFEIIIVIIILSIVLSISNIIPHKKYHNIDLAINQLKFHLQLTRNLALIDDKFDPNNPLWYRTRWTLKFRYCKNKEGIYYIIYSDKNAKGHPNKDESIKDPLSKKYLFANYSCNITQDESKYILLSKIYGITQVKISCNHTTSIGQISFGHDGTPYYKLSTQLDEQYKYALEHTCQIKLLTNDQSRIIYIEPTTGYIY